jgi:hypothetical protein
VADLLAWWNRCVAIKWCNCVLLLLMYSCRKVFGRTSGAPQPTQQHRASSSVSRVAEQRRAREASRVWERVCPICTIFVLLFQNWLFFSMTCRSCWLSECCTICAGFAKLRDYFDHFRDKCQGCAHCKPLKIFGSLQTLIFHPHFALQSTWEQ